MEINAWSSILQYCITENVANFDITFTDFEVSGQNIETEPKVSANFT